MCVHKAVKKKLMYKGQGGNQAKRKQKLENEVPEMKLACRTSDVRHAPNLFLKFSIARSERKKREEMICTQ